MTISPFENCLLREESLGSYALVPNNKLDELRTKLRLLGLKPDGYLIKLHPDELQCTHAFRQWFAESRIKQKQETS